MEKSFSNSYKEAGVDVTAGYKSVELMKSYVQSTYTDGVKGDLGGFGGLFAPNITNMNVKDAEKVLKDLGLQMSINVEEGIDISEMIITNQTPKEGITINSGTTIYCEIGT